MEHSIVIVGYGTMGISHTAKLRALGGVRVAGAVDIDPVRQGYAREDGLHVYADLEDALADPDVDMVFVCTPNDSHRPIALAALGAGRHVICEKPAMLDSAELEEVIALAESRGLVFAVHQNRRWDEDYLSIKRLYDDGTIGPITRIESRVHGSRGIPSDWRALPENGGGMLLDWGVHLVDRLLVMIDAPVVAVYARLSHVLGHTVDDGFTLLMTFGNGVEVVVDVSTTSYIPLPKWVAASATGTATIDDWEMHGKVLHRNTRSEADAAPIVAGAGMTKTMAPRAVDFAALVTNDESVEFLELPRVETDVSDFYRNVLAAVDGREALIVTHAQVLRCMRLLEAVAESHRTGAAVAFEPPAI
ncbi:Gfo/Idh/MocA family oxidoreductase [Demequina sp. SYSU T00039]|uniref:Gfo/Idh/MocA family oxidoreductase n=1 Tax=Demequina lignilytica TaxID=3051663 RepID=A0AAW7M4U4_9MICO|nr:MULTISPECIES: Gfo/Idh/MocA family oxidoreductase [unclassified Demequina]MDN4477929.1 Gfo/Idh/MocA family oxidoreductase [Demequina sp. SYSU T00039-1]MDN4487838.1 Gfo/Idh/MocA family oxidoreductase [Demequina sp. SYSU T00039]MDN4490779.1 Gfo/Idh/MocA family oxidoreductase [Demequina sp. SYSU T00068]